MVTLKKHLRLGQFLQKTTCQRRVLHVHCARAEASQGDNYVGTLQPTDTCITKEFALAIREVSIKRTTSQEVRSCIENCISRADKFPPRGLAMVCLALARIRAAAMHAFERFGSVARDALARRPHEFNEQDISNISNAFAKARYCSEAFFAELSFFLEAREPLAEFLSSQGLANTLNAYAAVSVRLSRHLQKDFEMASAARIFDFSAAQLANVLNSFARLQSSSAIRCSWDRWHTALHAQLPNFTIQGVSNSLNALVRLSVSEIDFFHRSIRQLSTHPPKDFKEQEVANILNACARVGLEDDFLVHFLGEEVLEQVLPSFTSQGLANTTLALSRLPHSRRSVIYLARECSSRASLQQKKLTWSEPHHVINTMFAFAIFGVRVQISDVWYHNFLLSMIRSLWQMMELCDHAVKAPRQKDEAPKLSPEAVSQLYAVLCDSILRRADVLHGLCFGDLARYSEAVELCDPQLLLRSFNDGLHANRYVEKSRLHREVSEIVVALDPFSGTSTIFDEAFVPPYVVDILIGRRLMGS